MEAKLQLGWRGKVGDLFDFARATILSKTGSDMGVVYFGKIVEAGIGLLSNVIVARALGPEKLGILMLVITFSTVMTVVMGYGLDQTAVKYIADSRKRGVWQLRAVIWAALRIRMLFIISGGIVAAFLCQHIATKIFNIPDMAVVLLLGILVAGTNSLFLLCQCFLRGLEEFRKVVISNTAGRALRLMIIVAIFLVSNLTVENVLWANVINAVIIVAIDMYILNKKTDKISASDISNSRNITMEMAKYSSWMYGSAVLFSLSDNLNTLMLGSIMPVASVGLYSVANNLIRPFEYFPETINQVLLPKMSGIVDYKHFVSTSRKIIASGFVMTLLLIPMVFFAGQIIRLLFGGKYEGAAIILQFLAGSMALCIVLNPLMLLGHRLNMPYIFTASNLIFLIIGILLNIILIPKYGEVGCALALFISTAISRGIILPVVYIQARKVLT